MEPIFLNDVKSVEMAKVWLNFDHDFPLSVKK